MPYIGRDLSQGNYLKLDNIESQFDGSKVSFDLTAGSTAFFPGSSMALLVSVGGVVQEAETAYTIDQSSIEFASAPSAGDDCYIIVMGTSIGVSVPADASVTMPKLAQSAIDRLSSVGISSGGTVIGAGVTFINFVQSGLTVAIPEATEAVNPDCTKFIKVTPAPITVPPDDIPTLDNLSIALCANFGIVTDASAGTDTPIDVPITII
jgi:hypothetical protein